MILSSREALRKEIQFQIEKGAVFNVDVTSYQHVEFCIKSKTTTISPYFNQKYDLIILDEAQHFIEGISIYTDLSFDWIIKQDAQKIFMSATANPLFRHLIEQDIVSLDYVYHIPKSYDYVNEVFFFNKKSDLALIVDDLYTNSKDKIIVFINSIPEAIKLYNKYKEEVTFYCSPSTKDEKAKDILNNQPFKIENETFPTRLLVATSALDVGITLKSYEIKHVVASIFSANQLAQCLGRKREITSRDKKLYIEGKKDTCKFYLRNFSKRELNIMDKSKDLKELSMFQYEPKKWQVKYGMDRLHKNKYINYNFKAKEFQLNDLGLITTEQNQRDLITIRGDGNNYGMGYKQFIIEQLHLPELKCKDYDNVKQQQQELTLEQYLDSVVGKPLHKDEQFGLKEVFKNNGLTARTLGINTLNGNLKDRKLPYLILAKRVDKWVNGKSKTIRYWEVSNNIQN